MGAMKLSRRVIRYFRTWLFVRRVGKDSAEYAKLIQQQERAEFLARHFGHDWSSVDRERSAGIIRDIEKAINEYK
jgi:hypothetical protein